VYKLSDKAAEDFAGIYDYTYINYGGQQAETYMTDIEYCLGSLSATPFIGWDCSELKSGMYRDDFKQHAIFYRIRKADVLIVRILHQQMNSLLQFEL